MYNSVHKQQNVTPAGIKRDFIHDTYETTSHTMKHWHETQRDKLTYSFKLQPNNDTDHRVSKFM